MSVFLRTAVLLTISNVFMTFAWYAHLKNLNHRKWYVAFLYMRQPMKLDYLWAGLCLLGAVFFIFRT